MGQQWVEITEQEFTQLKPSITDEQLARAKHQLENPTIKRGLTTYDCPFNDPVTGKCEVYNARPMICASYGVVSPIEDCNTDGPSNGTKVVNPMNVFGSLTDKNTKQYLKHLTMNIEPTTIMDEFKKLLDM